jgi:hypothetical protein
MIKKFENMKTHLKPRRSEIEKRQQEFIVPEVISKEKLKQIKIQVLQKN